MTRMRKLRTLGTAVGVGLALLVTAAACTSSGQDRKGGSTTPPTIGPVPSASTPVGLVLPLSHYELTGAQEVFVNKATTTLVNQCMRRFGFADFSLDGGGPVAGHGDQMARRYGPVSDAKAAAAYGYHLTPDQAAGVGKSSGGPRQQFSQAENAVLTGTAGNGPAAPNQTQGAGKAGNGQAIPAGGCYGEANRAIGSEDKADTLVPQKLAFTSYSQSQNDSRTKEVVAAWSTCMKGKGYNLTGPVDAAKAFNLEGPVTPTEIQQAVTDVACKQQVGLVGVWFSVESAYQQRLIEQNSQQLDAVRKLLDDKLRNAARTLGQAAPK